MALPKDTRSSLLIMCCFSDVTEAIVFAMLEKSVSLEKYSTDEFSKHSLLCLLIHETVIYVKVVKYFPFGHNFILNVPASSAQKLLPGKVPARITISRNGKFPKIHFLQ